MFLWRSVVSSVWIRVGVTGQFESRAAKDGVRPDPTPDDVRVAPGPFNSVLERCPSVADLPSNLEYPVSSPHRLHAQSAPELTGGKAREIHRELLDCILELLALILS